MAKLQGEVVGKPKPTDGDPDPKTQAVITYFAIQLKNEDPTFAAHRVSVTEEEYNSCEVGDIVSFDVTISSSNFDGKLKTKIKSLGEFRQLDSVR